MTKPCVECGEVCCERDAAWVGDEWWCLDCVVADCDEADWSDVSDSIADFGADDGGDIIPCYVVIQSATTANGLTVYRWRERDDLGAGSCDNGPAMISYEEAVAAGKAHAAEIDCEE